MSPEEKALAEIIRMQVAIQGRDCHCGGTPGCEICGGAGRIFPDRSDLGVQAMVYFDVIQASLELCPQTVMGLRRVLRAAAKYAEECQQKNFERGLKQAFDTGCVEEALEGMEKSADLLQGHSASFIHLVVRAVRECDGTWKDFQRRKARLVG